MFPAYEATVINPLWVSLKKRKTLLLSKLGSTKRIVIIYSITICDWFQLYRLIRFLQRIRAHGNRSASTGTLSSMLPAEGLAGPKKIMHLLDPNFPKNQISHSISAGRENKPACLKTGWIPECLIKLGGHPLEHSFIKNIKFIRIITNLGSSFPWAGFS